MLGGLHLDPQKKGMPLPWLVKGAPLKNTKCSGNGIEEHHGAHGERQQLCQWPSHIPSHGCVQLPKIFCLSLDIETEQNSPFNSEATCWEFTVLPHSKTKG